MNLAIVLGTRPEIIKMSPMIREYERKHIEHFILNTGQHYFYNMDRVFFELLKLPEAKIIAEQELNGYPINRLYWLFGTMVS